MGLVPLGVLICVLVGISVAVLLLLEEDAGRIADDEAELLEATPADVDWNRRGVPVLLREGNVEAETLHVHGSATGARKAN